MKITVLENDKKTEYLNIKPGEVFEYKGKLFLKINSVYINSTRFNCIDLENTGMYSFSNDTMCTFKESELIIK